MQKEGILTLGLMVIFNTSFSAESMNSNMLKLAASGAQAAYLSHVDLKPTLQWKIRLLL